MADLTLEPNRILISESLFYRMGLYEGDLLAIQYDDNKIPFIVKSETGNRLCNNFTFAFKGNKHRQLSQYGTEFEVANDYSLKGDGIVTEFDYSKNFEPDPVDVSVILDNDYKIKKFDKYIL